MSRAANVLFVAGTTAYMVAVTQRSTLGVAGVAAADRFHASAAALSTLGVLQLVVYAVLQVPVGLLVDRFGPRAVLLTGALLMIAGQVVVAMAPTLVVGVVGRMLVGAGDATTFVSVLRLVNSWFPGRAVPTRVQWLGNLGQLGQVLSVVPFAALLHLAGWTSAFLAAAGLSGVALVVLVLLVRDVPAGSADARAPSARSALVAFDASMRRPGTRLGFWSHFVTMSSGTMFALFWGYPFLIEACGLTPQAASALLTVQVAAGLSTGPVLGPLTARHPLRRSNLVLGVVMMLAVCWTAVLLWPGRPPIVLLVLLVIAMGVGGPASQIGFDYARTYNPASSLGGANGLVNVGGFTATFVMMLAVGLLLDVAHASSGAPLYAISGFRLAFCVQYVVVGFGVVMLVRTRRRARRDLAAETGAALPPVWVAVSRQVRARRARAGG